MRSWFTTVAILLAMLIEAPVHAQVDVTTTTAPLVVDAAGDLDGLVIQNNQVVILANSSGGKLLVYDKTATDTVDNSLIYNGPGGIGRFKSFLSGGSGGAIDIDDAMSDISSNPVENNVIKAYVDAQVVTTVDDTMSGVSTNPVENNVVKSYIDGLTYLTVDSAMSGASTNPVRNSTIKSYVDGLTYLTVDSAMSAGSNNPVRNSTIKAYVDGLTYLTVDNAMSAVSTNPVENNVIKAYVDAQIGGAVDDAMSGVSTNAVQNNVIKSYVDGLSYLTIDSSMNAGSNNAVQNSTVTTEINNRALVRSTDQVVIGTGTAATDDAAIDAALATLNSQGYGTLWFDGVLAVAAEHEFNGAISFRGLGPGAVINVEDPLAGFLWGPAETTTFDPRTTGNITGSDAGVSFQATAAFQSYIISENLELEEGDWFVVWSDDELSGMTKNATNQKPAELHYVFRRNTATVTASAGTEEFTETVSTGKTTTTFGDMRNGWPVRFASTGSVPSPLVAGTTYYVVNYDGAKSWQVEASVGGGAINLTDAGSGTITVESDTYVLGNFIVDAMTSNQTIRRIPMWAAPGSNNTSHVYVGDFRVSQDADVHDNQLWQFYFLNGLKLSNIHYQLDNGIGGPGYFRLNYCSNVSIDHLVVDGVDDYDTYTGGSTSGSLYMIQNQIVNGVTITNCHFNRTRHDIDCSNGFQNGTTRYGTPRGVTVSNCVFRHESHADGGLPPLSTHGEGWGIVYENNVIELGSTSHTTYACIARSRAMTFRNNKIYCAQVSRAAKGVLAEADDCIITGNEFWNCWRAAELDNDAAGFDRIQFTNNKCHGCGGVGSTDAVLIVKDTDDCIIKDNIFTNSAGANIRITYGAVDGIMDGNIFTSMSASGSQACVKFSGTGAASAENWKITNNLFDAIPETCIEFAGGASGVGDNNKIIHNTFVDCTGTSLIVFADDGTTSGHRISGNDAGKGTNTNFVNTGSLGSSAITLIGNSVDGYGAGSLGLTGTNASTINTNQAGNNWTD